MPRVRVLAALLLSLVAAAPGHAAEPLRHVLILHSFGQQFAPYNAIAGPFRQELIREASGPLAISEVTLEAVQGKMPSDDRALLDYLHALFAGDPPGLIVTIGAPATVFVQRHRAALFPDTPLLVIATEQRRVSERALTDRDVVVALALDIPTLVETILEVQAEVRTVFVVLGASPLERLWRTYAEEDLAGFAGRIELEFSSDLDFAAILKRVAALPPDAAVLYGLMIVDAAGVPYEEGETIAALSYASAVPVYGIYDSQLGDGILGGRMLPMLQLAMRSAEAGARLLEGAPATSIRMPPIVLGAPAFDGRQLARFGIAEAALPAGSTVLFREPGAWSRFRGPILAAVALTLLQSAFITGLLVSRRRLRVSQAALTESEARLRKAAGEARDFAGRLIHAQEDERSRLGRELHDDITQRLAVLAIDVGRCERAAEGTPAADALAGAREGLARLSSDVHALSYQLHPSILADLGLVVALENEAERVSRIDGLPVAFVAADIPDALPPPVSLCLFRVAQEALRNVVRHAAARSARVVLDAVPGYIRLVVEDDGVGFDPRSPGRGPSLGLESMQQRVAAVGGRLDVETASGQGTRVEVVVPLEEDAR